jgi:hypothetical protein
VVASTLSDLVAKAKRVGISGLTADEILRLERVRRTIRPESDKYEAHKKKSMARQRAQSLAGREIGELPAVERPEIKEAARRDFRRFCEEYLKPTFSLPWSRDHLRVIAKIEQAVLEGGLFAMAMPRGSGKTSLCESACLWSLVYGHREFVALIGGDEDHAAKMLESIKSELEDNDLLLGDFPEVAYPIRGLAGINQRATGQLHHGKRTRIGWTANEIILPTIEGSPASGAIVRVSGITGRIRGMKHKRADGTAIRPALVLIDDPQKDEVARSPAQVVAREQVLAGAVLGLSGPGRKIAGLMTLTVIRPDDLADRILDRDKHPQWQGERTKMVYSFPTNNDLWNQYGEAWRDSVNAGKGIAGATEFYRANREAMDAGADVAWPERYNPDELSAIQHAYDLILERGERAFWAEYQNVPLSEDPSGDENLTADDILAKLNGFGRRDVPIGCNACTMFIDVQETMLYWLVVAWEPDFTGYIIDYGTEPDQKAEYFRLREARYTLVSEAGAGVEGRIHAGLTRLTESMLSREWRRDDGAMLRIDRCLIDASGRMADLIYQFCRTSTYAATVTPSHGRYVGARNVAFLHYARKKGDKIGLNWRVPAIPGRAREVRHVTYDTNFWKSFVRSRIRVPIGDPSCLSLWGRSKESHRMVADHFASEYSVRTARTEGQLRPVDEWKLRGAGHDNHFWDCVVGAAVAASMSGIALTELPGETAPKRNRGPKMSMRDRRELARSERDNAATKTW